MAIKLLIKKTGKFFYLEREGSEINVTTDEFLDSIEIEFKQLSKPQDQITFLKEILLIIMKQKDPLKNYTELEKDWLDFNLKYPNNNLQIFFNSTIVKDSNFNRKEVTPLLFKNLRYYHLFLQVIEYSLSSNLYKLNEELSQTISAQENKPTIKQLALSIYYKQLAGTILDFPEGEKTKSLLEIAKQNSVNLKNLMTAYNSFSSNGSEKKRLQFLREEDNQRKLSKLLENDEKALNELNREIDKLRSPTP